MARGGGPPVTTRTRWPLASCLHQRGPPSVPHLNAEAPGQVSFSQHALQPAGRHDTAIGHEQDVGESRWDLLDVMGDQHHRRRGRIGSQGPEDDD